MSVNTHSLDLEADTSQYANRVDSVSLSITDDMTVECWLKMETLPAAAGIMSIFNKFDHVADKRSYNFGVFNDGGTYKGRLAISPDGTAGATTEAAVAITISAGVWIHLAWIYDASAGELEVAENGVSVGTAGGLANSIHDNDLDFQLGCYRKASQFYDGLIDEARIWAAEKLVADILANKDKEAVGNEPNLNACWHLNNDYLDATANSNDLTAVNNPVFSTDVPFTGIVGGMPMIFGGGVTIG